MQVAGRVSTPRGVAEELSEKIRARNAKTVVVGLGYVGLPLIAELGRAGFAVTGIDKDLQKIDSIRQGNSYIADVDSVLFAKLVNSGTIKAVAEKSPLNDCDTVSICVPTPLRKTKDPDMTFVAAAAKDVASCLHPGMLVILESTTYPGATEEVILPMLRKSGLKAGEDYFLCFSPERVDPGNRRFSTRTIPKVIGGITPKCTEMGALFYSQVMDRVVPVSSARVAEMVKLLENTFRMINIGLANEIALMCDRMDLDVWEVIEAAATKPFGFMPFFPGPGLGGHCIPVDPHYLSWKMKQTGHEPRFIQLAAQINGFMPQFVVEKIQAALNEASKPVKNSRIHIVGVAYKRDVSDVRESPALDIMTLLEKRGGIIAYSDPFVPRLQFNSRILESQPLEMAAARADCVVIVADHSGIDYNRLVQDAPLIVDTRNRLKDITSSKILRL